MEVLMAEVMLGRTTSTTIKLCFNDAAVLITLGWNFTSSGFDDIFGGMAMNVINLHSSCTMILLGILASTTIIGLTSSAPLSPYERRDVSDDRPKIFLLIDQRIPELEDEMLNSENDLGSDVMRTKRIGSLSIVNNFDVLRQRVMLELARRKALQDQRQVDENRRFLESIGKRSVSDAGRNVRSGMKNSRERPAASNRNEWIEENNPLFRGSQDDDRTVQTNELRLLK
ncbi:diuretic hormone 44 [Temnothorax nylanderi]|uniref:diuretic hormone 44 n=1 Tax=Temnothorax nylanderi TaxID=102681 RepID=UPI003A8A8A4E